MFCFQTAIIIKYYVLYELLYSTEFVEMQTKRVLTKEKYPEANPPYSNPEFKNVLVDKP